MIGERLYAVGPSYVRALSPTLTTGVCTRCYVDRVQATSGRCACEDVEERLRIRRDTISSEARETRPMSTSDRQPSSEPVRVIPLGVDRGAYRKFKRLAQKLQRKIDAGSVTEQEALNRLGVEL